MQAWWLAAGLSLFVSGALAAEPGLPETVVALPQVASADANSVQLQVPAETAGVVVSPIPMPGGVIEVLKPLGKLSKPRLVRKALPTPNKHFPAVMLSRTERYQMALLSARRDAERTGPAHDQANDENDDDGYDDQVFHRSYGRPRLAVDEGSGDQGDLDAAFPISDHARLRLFLARMKAMEAHALAQVEDSGEALSDHVVSRLAAARQKALAAHQQKFS